VLSVPGRPGLWPLAIIGAADFIEKTENAQLLFI
jgi:hypothetical protein